MEPTVKFEGPVEKTSAFFKNKTKIWMVLEGLTLTHFKDNKKTFCVGSIDLTEVQAARQTQQKQGREFEVTTKSTTFTFTAETDELALAWVRVIQQAMLQKPLTNEPCVTYSAPMMFSSEYAEVSELVPTVESNPQKNKIYEELSEIQPSQERNIFGVKLKSSFHRAHSTTTSNEAVANESTKSSKEPEPVYAQPDKTRVKRNVENCPKDSTQKKEKSSHGRVFHKPPPSFAPPPPPTKLINKNKPEASYVSKSVTEKMKDETKEAQSRSEDNDDDHEYYFADSIKRPNAESEVNDSQSLTSGNTMGKDKLDSSSFKPYESSYEDIDYLSTSVTETSNIVKKCTSHENAYEVVELPQTVMKKDNLDYKSENSRNYYEDVDITQVVRRSRGSHVTTSYIEKSTDSTDETVNESPDADGVIASNKQTASDRRENFRLSSEVKYRSTEDNENDEVFIDNDKESADCSEPETLNEVIKYQALDAVMNCIDNTDNDFNFIEDGKAFVNLKRYLETNSDGGFDLESHQMSSRNSIERLKTLLSAKV